MDTFRVRYTFDHVHVKCHDINAAKRFYEEMFHAKTVYEGELRGARSIMMELGGTYLNLSEPGKGEELEPLNPRKDVWIRYGIGHFGVQVKNLDEAARELRAKGAEFIREPRDIREGVRAAFIKGPEDDVIEVIQRGE